MDSSAGVTLEGFLRFKAFLKRFLQAVVGQDSPMSVGVAQYGDDVEIPIELGQQKDTLSLMKSIDALNFSGGRTLTGRALQYIAQHGFRSTPVFADVQGDLPRVVVLLTDSKSQDSVAEAAKYAKNQNLFLIGVGSSFMRAELTTVTGNPQQTIVYSDPQDLFNRIPELQRKICSVGNPEGKTVVWALWDKFAEPCRGVLNSIREEGRTEGQMSLFVCQPQIQALTFHE